MGQSGARTGSNLAQIAAIAGGFLVLAGVVVKWFEASGVEYSGTEDWTGVGALAIGVVVILGGLAAMDTFVKATSTRRFGALVAAAAGLVAILLVALAFTRADSVVAGGTASLGLWVSGVGGLFGAVGGWLATQAIGGSSS